MKVRSKKQEICLEIEKHESKKQEICLEIERQVVKTNYH